jgi:tripeptide aminopeptidase
MAGHVVEERLVETFLELARIDSPSSEESRVAAWCAGALSALDFSVHFDGSASHTGSDTGNLIAELPGQCNRTLLLSAHMDCVQPCRGVEPIVESGIVRSAGDTVLGGDDKAGIAAIIEACHAAVASGDKLPTIRVVLTVQEEIGLCGAKVLPAGALEGDLCLVLDAEGAPGGIIVAAPTHYTFAAEFAGRASHAGVAPENGINAIAMASSAVEAMELGRLDEDTTANVGSIQGGSATNVVPPIVKMTGECRSLDRERVEVVRERMERCMHAAAEKFGGSVKVAWTKEYEGFLLRDDDPAVRLVSEACGDAGLEVHPKRTGGGSDANIIAAHGVPTVALSCGMTNVHSTDEQIAVADMVSLARLVGAVIDRLAV